MLYSLKDYVLSAKAPYQRGILVLLGVVFFVPFIGGVHLFDWDEINFAEITREMILTGDYFRSQINFEPFYEKPPLFNWLQILSFKIFGNNEFSARFPNAFFGICSLLLIHYVGTKFRDKTFGMLWALLYMGSILPLFYFKTGVIDPVFNFFIFASLCLLAKGYAKNTSKYFFFGGLINGLAIITKGPVGFLIVGLTILAYGLLYARRWSWIRCMQLGLFVMGAIIITSVWILPQYISGGSDFIISFFDYMIALLTEDVATHGQPFYYHFLVILFGCFPISVWGGERLLSFGNNDSNKGLFRWMLLIFWVVLLLFSCVTTKIVHYSSMCYFPLAYLAADSLVKLKTNGNPGKLRLIFYLVMGIFFSVVFVGAPLLFIDKTWLISLVKRDIFAREIIKIMDISPAIALWGLVFVAGVWMTYFAYKRGKIYKMIITNTLLFSIFFNGELALLLPRVEAAVQGPAIEFYKRFAGKDVYFATIGFKSYGQFYYLQKQKWKSKYSTEQLIDESLDKPVYLVTRVDSDHRVLMKKNIKFLKQKGGFQLYVKHPSDE